MSDGLEGVIAVHTELSDVDGEAGRLILRGVDLEAIAGTESFEGILMHFWRGLVDEPAVAEMSAGPVQQALGTLRGQAYARMLDLNRHAEGMSVIEALRFALASLADDAPSPGTMAAAAMPVFTAGFSRQSRGLEPVAPDAGMSHAADFLRMLHDKRPTAEDVSALETYWATVADHGMNASTFAARVVASTLAGMTSSVVAGLCALKGPLHGGAPGPVLDMLDEIGSAENAGPWLADALAAGVRLMGFGHRVYRVRDPRADVLKCVATSMRRNDNRIPLAEAVEASALEALAAHKPDRPLDTNVEFYTALVLEALEIPRDCFTPAFACGRVIGWVAHISEQVSKGRLIRPASEYTGVVPELH